MTRRSLLVSFVITAAVGAAGCHSHEEDAVAAELSDVVFLEGTSDEALLTLLSAEAEADADRRVAFDSPADGEPLPSSPPGVFSWHRTGTTAALGHHRGTTIPRWRRLLTGLGAFLRPVSVAHAHGTPFNGTGYFLVFSSASDDRVLRVFQASESYVPAADAWSALVAAGEPITLTVTSADFENNLLLDGPFAGGTLTFTIE